METFLKILKFLNNMKTKKFRVWDDKTKSFWYGGVRELFGHIPSDVPDEHIQQYTDLHDKKWKPIYEGDIVSGFCLNDGPQICVVGFGTWGIYYTKIKYYPCEEWDNVAMLAQEHNEIIGNIFENPELLK